ncbi:hypothetical protein DBR06_SOUSAS3710126, partial [Sousa chinensis]
GLLYSLRDAALEGVGHFFHESTVEKLESAQHLLKMQNQHSDCTLFQDMQKLSQDELGKTLDVKEPAMAMEKNLSQALEDLHAL